MEIALTVLWLLARLTRIRPDFLGMPIVASASHGWADQWEPMTVDDFVVKMIINVPEKMR